MRDNSDMVEKKLAFHISQPSPLCLATAQHRQCTTQHIVLGGVVGSTDLVDGREQDSLVNLLVLATLDVDVLAITGGVSHQQGRGAGHGAGRLQLHVQLVHQLPHAGQHGALGPCGRERVDADGDGGCGEKRVEATRIGEHGALSSG